MTQDERSLRGDSKTQSIFDCANRADAEIWLTDIIQQWPENVRVYFMKQRKDAVLLDCQTVEARKLAGLQTPNGKVAGPSTQNNEGSPTGRT